MLTGRLGIAMPPVDLVEPVIGKSLGSVEAKPDQNGQSDLRQGPAKATKVISVLPRFHRFLMDSAGRIRNGNPVERGTFRVPPMGSMGDRHYTRSLPARSDVGDGCPEPQRPCSDFDWIVAASR